MVIYLEDISLLNQYSQMLMKNIASLPWLLENLGFLINWKKSVTVPLQEMQFLGLLVNLVEMQITLPSEKITRIVVKCQRKKTTTERKLDKIQAQVT